MLALKEGTCPRYCKRNVMHDVLLNPLADSPEKSRGAIYTRREVVETA